MTRVDLLFVLAIVGALSYGAAWAIVSCVPVVECPTLREAGKPRPPMVPDP